VMQMLHNQSFLDHRHHLIQLQGQSVLNLATDQQEVHL